MKRNVEIKARVSDEAGFVRRAMEIAGTEPEVIVQADTFFDAPHGRLKLRRLSPDRSELIFYERTDTAGPKTSNYGIVSVDDPDALQAALAGALGIRGEVRKTRRLFMAGRTRIHLDEVECLGTFMELEVVLGEDEDITVGEAEAHDLMTRLGVEDNDLVQGAYIDLLEG